MKTGYFIGFDIGGSKIAGGLFSLQGELIAEKVEKTPSSYERFLETCRRITTELEKRAEAPCAVGVGIAGRIIDGDLQDAAPSMPFLRDKTLRIDLEKVLGREIKIANDANCMALAEALYGSGKGFSSVVGLIVGTGVGSGFVYKGKIIEGTNGLAGEIGHLPLPFGEEQCKDLGRCGCGQTGCIEQFISGGGLSRLYFSAVGEKLDAKSIFDRAKIGDKAALDTLDRYFEIFAKAMVVIIHSFDPEVIVVSGGLNSLPGLYEEVPKRWGRYAYTYKIRTKIAPALLGPMSGMHGAALLWLDER